MPKIDSDSPESFLPCRFHALVMISVMIIEKMPKLWIFHSLIQLIQSSRFRWEASTVSRPISSASWKPTAFKISFQDKSFIHLHTLENRRNEKTWKAKIAIRMPTSRLRNTTRNAGFVIYEACQVRIAAGCKTPIKISKILSQHTVKDFE